MIKQSGQKQSNASSRKKVEAIYQQQKQVAEAFKIDHFYDKNNLNLEELRSRLSIFKRTIKQSPNNHKEQSGSPIRIYQQQSSAKFGRLRTLQNKKKEYQTQISTNNFAFDRTSSNYSQPHSGRKSNYLQKMNQKYHKKPILMDPIQTSWESKSKTSYKPNDKTSGLNSYRYGKNRKRIKTVTDKQDCSKCSQSSLIKSSDEGSFQGRIKLSTQGEVCQMQNQIQLLWSHYQLLTRVLIGLHDNIRGEKNNIVKYRDLVCSKKFQFLKQLHDQLDKNSFSKQQITFIKRLSRSIVLSRVYQNLGINYVTLFICLQQKPNAHLTNCIGYATSSIAFLIKIISLIHSLQPPLAISSSTLDILQTINQYERGTFGCKIVKISELALRLQQNNEVMNIVQVKLCYKMNPLFQETVSNLLKNIDLDNKPINQYSHYIFQFLAFHLVSLNIFGPFPAVQIPPAPYFTFFPKKKTLVIEPWGVLFSRKHGSTFVRAHTQLFLSEVGKHWNIIYWSTLMPREIDDLLQKLPCGRCLYRYHCLYATDYFIKPLQRIGCDVHNTMVIDVSQNIFHYHKEIGIALPWKAQRKDIKLLDILDILQPIFLNQQASMSTYITMIKNSLSSSLKSKSPLRRKPKRQKSQSNQSYLYPQKINSHR